MSPTDRIIYSKVARDAQQFCWSRNSINRNVISLLFRSRAHFSIYTLATAIWILITPWFLSIGAEQKWTEWCRTVKYLTNFGGKRNSKTFRITQANLETCSDRQVILKQVKNKWVVRLKMCQKRNARKNQNVDNINVSPLVSEPGRWGQVYLSANKFSPWNRHFGKYTSSD